MKKITETDKTNGFILATNTTVGSEKRWSKRSKTPLTDKELIDALSYELGIFGGQSARNSLNITYTKSDLKIWISWKSINTYNIPPIFYNKSTIAKARDVYQIKNPDDKQLKLL